MRPANDPLDRLLKAAAAAPKPTASPLPFAVEARVLAAWRRGEPDSELAALVSLFRRGLACACGVAMLVTTLCWFGREPAGASLTVEEFALSADAITLALAR
jgi:hypothetical protein